jgi:hypothetical protein
MIRPCLLQDEQTNLVYPDERRQGSMGPEGPPAKSMGPEGLPAKEERKTMKSKKTEHTLLRASAIAALAVLTFVPLTVRADCVPTVQPGWTVPFTMVTLNNDPNHHFASYTTGGLTGSATWYNSTWSGDNSRHRAVDRNFAKITHVFRAAYTFENASLSVALLLHGMQRQFARGEKMSFYHTEISTWQKVEFSPQHRGRALDHDFLRWSSAASAASFLLARRPRPEISSCRYGLSCTMYIRR